MTDLALDPNPLAPDASRDFRIISVVAGAHFTSHFFMIALPPLFPLVREQWGVSYTELGFVMSVFFVSSALGQVVSGFLVDRFGPHIVLPIGMAILAGSTMLMGLVPVYWMLLPLSMFAGLGNSVYHPADYSVLSNRITTGRIGRGYSMHTVMGTIGWAAPPVTMVTLGSYFGWQHALVIVGAIGLVIAAFVALDRADLELPKIKAANPDQKKAPISALFSLPIVMGFVFFTLLSMSLGVVQSFMTTILPQVQSVSLAFASTFTTIYFAVNALGSVAGGWVADRRGRFESTIAMGLVVAAVLMMAIGFIPMPTWALLAAGCVAGVVVGITLPSRDMLMRQAAPAGSTGKVFGFVYSGLDVGALLVPLCIGPMLDHGFYRLPFVYMAATLALTIVSAWVVKRSAVAK